MGQQLNLLTDGRRGVEHPVVDRSAQPHRLRLDDRCWVDLWPGWLLAPAVAMAEVQHGLAWHRGRRRMYGRWVDEPRLTAAAHADDPGVPTVVRRAADGLGDAYGLTLRSMWANWYRSGDDAVAWHADRIGRHERDPLVAVLSLGGPRDLALRPKCGGPHRRVTMHSGDLLVMGGSCQHDWEHSVPRCRQGAGRISLTFRHRTVMAGGAERVESS